MKLSYPDLGNLKRKKYENIMKKVLTFIFIAVAVGMTSCSLDEMQDIEQIETLSTDPGDPPGEETGEEGDLEPNG